MERIQLSRFERSRPKRLHRVSSARERCVLFVPDHGAIHIQDRPPIVQASDHPRRRHNAHAAWRRSNEQSIMFRIYENKDWPTEKLQRQTIRRPKYDWPIEIHHRYVNEGQGRRTDTWSSSIIIMWYSAQNWALWRLQQLLHKYTRSLPKSLLICPISNFDEYGLERLTVLDINGLSLSLYHLLPLTVMTARWVSENSDIFCFIIPTGN